MVQRQEPSAGNDIPTKRERRKSSEAARTAFAREGAESAFAVTFRSMEIGQTSVADALGIVKRANSETVPERVKAVKGMRITFATLDNAPYNQNVADFLEGAASLIPSLRADLATEVIAGLGKAMQNRAYYDVARPAVEKLLQEPDRLTGNLKPCLEALRLMPAPRNHGSFDEDHPTPLDVPVTGPRAARTDGPPAVIPLPGPAPCPDGMIMEPGPITADPAAENTAWKKAWKGAAVAVGIIAIAGLGYPEIRRVIMVVPFLSIIEQTTNVYRRLLEPLFGPQYVLEHHSLADVRSRGEDLTRDCDNEEEARRTARLLTENWDAPLILTTSVQFFESLFANRPAKCRKLHRLANSIILFDEVQTLPPRIAVPSLAALSRLAERYGCTVVFSTATQPAFDHLHNKVKLFAGMGWKPQTIMEEPQRIFNQARRVRIDWQIKESRSWESVADELSLDENSRSLCIVNLKRHAKQLVNRLRDRLGESGLFHLSTNMCPAHRQKVLTEVREQLTSVGLPPCRLISTQCIEAGVDLDFPVAWRAFGPLDAIAQAAGRCNREGKLNGQGRMVVFLPEKESSREYLYPPGGYKEATETTNTLFKLKENEARENGIPLENAFDIYDPELFNLYYRLLYDLTGATNLHQDLDDAIQRRSFVDVAQHYQVIPQKSINVFVPFMDILAPDSDEITLFDSLNERLTRETRLTRAWIQDAKPLTVSIYRPRKDDGVWQYLEPAPLGRGEKADDWFIYTNPKDYNPLLGLNPLNEVGMWTV